MCPLIIINARRTGAKIKKQNVKDDFFLKNWMFNFVSLLKYKRQMAGNKLCKPAQRSGAGLHIICYPSSEVYTSINWQN